MLLWTCTDKWNFPKDVSLIQVKHVIKTSQSRVSSRNKADKQFISQIFSDENQLQASSIHRTLRRHVITGQS